MFGEKEVVDEHGALDTNMPRTAGPERTSFAEKMGGDQHQAHGTLTTGATLVRKFGSLLGGRGGDDSRRSTASKRGTILSGLSGDGESEKTPSAEQPEEVAEKASAEAKDTGRKSPAPKSIAHSLSQPMGNTHRRATTVLDPHGRATRHERRSSTGGALLASVGGSVGRNRRPSTGYGSSTRPMAGKFGRTEEEETREHDGEDTAEEEDGGAVNGHDESYGEEGERHINEKDFKPVFLKGLFRYKFAS